MTDGDSKQPATSGVGPKGGGGPKGPDWTLEKIRLLNDEAVRTLKGNAERRANQAVAEMCADILLERHPPRAPTSVSSGTVSRTAQDKREEKQSAGLLGNLALRLLERFDLSKETAKHLSAGTTGFIAHSFVGKNGVAKVGGCQKTNNLVFSRYISYRLRDETCHFNIVKFPNQDHIVFEVMGSERFFTEPKPISEMRPYLKEGEKIGIYHCGQHFDDFETAAEFYEQALEKFAPLKKA